MVYRVPKVSLFRRTARQEALFLKRSRVAQFSYDQMIGNGAMADIYEEPVRGLGTVAVKVPRLSLWKEKYRRSPQEILLREAKMLARLNHPNIVGLLARWQTDNVWRFAMECCSYSVAEAFDEKPFAMDFSLYVFREVGKALQHAHEKGVAHADIKPENVLLKDGDHDEAAPSVKVCDFGVAEESHEEPDMGVIKGTPGFISPEVVELARRVDPKADMFSLGCMLYEMLGGQLDLSQDSPNEIWNAALDNREAIMDTDQFDPAINRLLYALVDPGGPIEDGAALMSYLNDQVPWIMTDIPQAGARLAAMRPDRSEVAVSGNRSRNSTVVIDCNLAI